MNILSNRGVLGQGACLDALISILLDSSANQMVCNSASLIYKTLPTGFRFRALDLA